MTVVDLKLAEDDPAAKEKSSCGGRRCCGPQSGRRVGRVEEVPDFQHKDYILDYYRLERPRLSHFWMLHNELGNMWTHLLAAGFMLYRFSTWMEAQLSKGNPLQQEWPRPVYFMGVALFFFFSLMVFCVSVTFHWRMCTPRREFMCWRCLDQSSCLALVVLGYFGGIPMGFACHPEVRDRYAMGAVAVLSIVALSVACLRKGHSTIVCGIIGLGVSWSAFPVVHWMRISTVGRQVAGAKVMVAIVCGVIASIAFFRMFPECSAPGRFDLFFSSHQIWHVLIFAAILLYGDSLAAVYEICSTPEYCLP